LRESEVMSKIVISLDSEISNTALIDIRRVTNLDLSEIRQSVSSGEPLVEFPLFYNDHDEVSQKLRNLVSIFTSNSIEASFFELEEDEELNLDNRDLTEISSTTLLNILEAHDSGIERMERSADQ
jgi:hypothetical protein